MIERWRSHGIAIPAGVDESAIADFETRYGVKMPNDMREYFVAVNGMGEYGTCDEEMFCFFPLQHVQSIAEWVPDRLHKFQHSAEYFLFADHSISLPSFAIRLDRQQNTVNPLASVFSDFGHLLVQNFYTSFSDFLSQYLNDPWKTASLLPEQVELTIKNAK